MKFLRWTKKLPGSHIYDLRSWFGLGKTYVAITDRGIWHFCDQKCNYTPAQQTLLLRKLREFAISEQIALKGYLYL